MSALIKSGDRQRLAEVRWPAVGPESRPEGSARAIPSSSDIRIAELEQALADAEARLDIAQRRTQELVAAERTDAHAKGMAAGRATSDALLKSLADAAEDARRDGQAALRESAAAGLAIARSALAQIFTEAAPWPAMVADIIGKRRGAIEDALVVRIRVSGEDFPDEAALQSLQGAGDGLHVLADPGLAPGECLFELRLGDVEVGPRPQGQRLLAFLDEQFAREVAA